MKRIRKRIFRHLKIFFYSLLALIAAFFLLNFLFPLKLSIAYSTEIRDKKNNLVHAYLSEDDKWRMPLDSANLSSSIEKAFLFKEDRYFYYHFGFNPFSIVRAAMNNLSSGRTLGASTITMQLARLMEPKERTLLSKLWELFRALQLELYYSKEEILSFYLTLAPFGGNIEGLSAASWSYFGKEPARLSLGEITTLLLIPNHPNRYPLNPNSKKLLQARNIWLARMQKNKVFKEVLIKDALNEPLTLKRQPLPKYAPHLSRLLKSKYPAKTPIKSSIELEFQEKIRSITVAQMPLLRSRGINNASVLLLDNRTRKVLAYLGSSDFYDDQNAGQVDGLIALRSPGSTLKPALYAYAFDKGELIPKSILNDIPINIRGYEPENYNETCNGPVTAAFALKNSLNIPPVKILNEMGTIPFLSFLRSAGFERLYRRKRYLGLSMILGGCTVSPVELSTFYSTLANKGCYAPINFLKADTVSSQDTILSPEAAYLISEILTSSQRPDLPQSWKNTNENGKIAWKTGTSYGRKDAWTIGYNSKYTLCVWVGNFSGHGSADLLGVDCAAPLFFKIFRYLNQEGKEDWLRPPKDLDFQFVCSESGQLPGEHCKNELLAYYLPGRTTLKRCELHRSFYVDKSESIEFCPSCIPESGYKKKIYKDYAPDLCAYFDKELIPYDKIPKHNPDCKRDGRNKKLKIESPVNELSYLLDINEQSEIALRANSASNEELFWFLNGKNVGSSLNGENFFIEPPEGKVQITCTTNSGQKATVVCYVEKIKL